MSLDLWLAFTAAAAIVLIIPGPTIMLVVGYAMAKGRRTAWMTVTGVALGDFLAMTVSLAGLGALLATSATVFTVLTWIGAGYLVYLGIKMWRLRPEPPDATVPSTNRSDRAMLWHAFVVTALNPKSIVFFVAFFPQFITADAAVLPQVTVLGATFLVLAVANAIGYALLAGSVRNAVRRPATLTWINRCGGSVLIGAGVLTAMMRRA